MDQFDYKLMGDDTIDGAACWKIESKPKQTKSSQYTSSLVWVRKDNYVVAQIESYSKDKLVRRIHYSDIENVSRDLDAANCGSVRRRPQQPHGIEAGETRIQRPDEGRRFYARGIKAWVSWRGRFCLCFCRSPPPRKTSTSADSSKAICRYIPKPRPTTAVKPSTTACFDMKLLTKCSRGCDWPVRSTHASIRTEKWNARCTWTGRIARCGVPRLSLREFNATITKGKLTAEFGKQFIRWGKADILNPTDRFAPKDFLTVTDPDFLAVLAARVIYDTGTDSFDFVWQPRFTPSRTPLINERWTVLPQAIEGLELMDLGSEFPGRSAFGARWNHIGSGYEVSASFYDGFNSSAGVSNGLKPARKCGQLSPHLSRACDCMAPTPPCRCAGSP